MSSINIYLFKQVVYESVCEAQIKIFDNASGPVEAKYNKFMEVWRNIVSLTTSFLDKNFNEQCLFGDGSYLKPLGKALLFMQNKAETSEKEYLSYTDPKNINQIKAKASEIDACYENSRNLVGVDKDETVINFCRYLNFKSCSSNKLFNISLTSYNMPEALKCTKELFKDSSDTPIEGLVNFTNYFVKAFDCKEGNPEQYESARHLYDEITEKEEKVNERQSLFHGYQRAALDFTKFTQKCY